MDKNVILITGASSGIGKVTAKYLSSKGNIVVATSRRAPSVEKINFSKEVSYPLLIQMDVTDEKSIKDGISFIQTRIGDIDVLINNAGIGISGPIEDISKEHMKAIFDTNFFGAMTVTQHVLPMMRAKKNGLIIMVSSIAGVIGLPYQGVYSASKFALEGISEALRLELKSFGVNVVLLEPGVFNTPFTDNRRKIQNESSVYDDELRKTITVFEQDERRGLHPILIAYTMENIIGSAKQKVRYRPGKISHKLAAGLKGVISDRIIQWIVAKYYHLK